MPKPRLELTWIGKEHRPSLEPRILIEDSEKSRGSRKSPNMLIHGDNLLALKALEYCRQATEYNARHNEKPWRYAIIPGNKVSLQMSFEGLVKQFGEEG